MSLGKKPIGKAIWGTTTYRVHLETSAKTFSEDISGVLTLYERRWVSQKAEFGNRKEMIVALREMWESSLRQGIIQDARFARWLEEYLNELGIPVDYEDVLKVVKGEVETEVNVSQISPEELVQLLESEKDLDAEELQTIDEHTEGIVTSGVSIGFVREVGKDQSEEILHTLAEKYKPTPNLSSKSSVKFLDANGEKKEVVQDNPIVSSPTTGFMIQKVGFVNPFGSATTNVEIETNIPYDFELLEFNIEGPLSRIGENKSKEGLQIKWQADTLAPGQKVEILFRLLPRIVRTVIIQHPTFASIYRVFEPLQKTEQGYRCESKISNPTASSLDSLVILDQIPRFLNIKSSEPPINPPLASVNLTEESIEVNWMFHDIGPESTLTIQYELEDRPYLVRDIYVVNTPESVPIFEGLKLVKPLRRQSGFGIIFGCRGLRDIQQTVIIEDRIPKDVKVSIIDTTVGDMTVREEGDEIVVKWEIKGIRRGKEEFAYLKYKPENQLESTVLNIAIEDQKAISISKEATSRKADSIVMPRKFIEELDVKP
ncbi:MAG: hypothetical protein D6732_02580 [Methanobacteriota archaeon]|nr:MAG: hypothetical protein D6732_02580 [Euryarchaeota archaeon]